MQLFFTNLLIELDKGNPISLATILTKQGSTPQVPGASAVFNQSGLLLGTLGGGILEAEVQATTINALNRKKDLIVDYSLDSKIQDDSGAICGGYTSILVDTHPGDHLIVFKDLVASLKANKPGILITIIDKNSADKKLRRHWNSKGDDIDVDELKYNKNLAEEITHTLRNGIPLLMKDENTGHLIFYEPIYPDPHLVIVGAGHIGKALSHLGKLLDFYVTVIDDRPEHANKENIPDADEIVSNDVESDLLGIDITDNTYIVIVTQGHRKDTIALKQCIHSNAAYIGMIGSKRKTRLMKEDFLSKKWALKEELDKIYAPIGINIHSKTVQEIAISIAGQLVQKRQEKMAKEMGEVIDIVILAAGKSVRMGQQKLLMQYNEKTIIEHILEIALASNANNVKVVMGSHLDEITEKIRHMPVEIIVNERFEEGMLSSVQCGFNALSEKSKAGIILLGDQPMVQTDVINKLIDSYNKSGKGIIIPVYNDHRGHPVLIESRYGSEINNLDVHVGLRQLMINNAADIHEMEVDTNTILKDIDTIEDYKKEFK